MTFEIRPFSPEEAALFYSNDEKTKSLAVSGTCEGISGTRAGSFGIHGLTIKVR
jgi:hypothetical protein